MQRKLWEASPNDGEWVSEPVVSWSHHCFAIAVDVTLVDLERGLEQVLPTDFDEFTEDASWKYHGKNSRVSWNLTLLQQAMRAGGFHAATDEWWHFTDPQSNGKAQLVYAAELGIQLPE